MEIEQEQSQFHITPEIAFVQSKDFHGESFDSRLSFKSIDESEQKFSITFSKLYQWLDSLTGKASHKVVTWDNTYKIFLDILNLLKREGLVRNASISWCRYNDAPAFRRCSIAPGFPAGSTDGTTTHSRAFGHGFGKDIAIVLSKAIGEFLERYFLMLFHKKNFTRGSYASLNKKGLRAINPENLAGFTAEQKKLYPRREFDVESIFFWEQAERISSGKRIFVPAQLIYWNYDVITGEHEPKLAEANTNGAGGFFSKEGAILSGIYELIQRDSFLIYWLNTIAPSKIIPESVPDDEFQQLLAETKRYGFSVNCLNTTLDTGIPSFVVVIIDPTGKCPSFSLGGGCEANPARALRRALEEAWSVYYWMRPLAYYALPKDYAPFYDERIGQMERLCLAANPTMMPRYKWFLSGSSQRFETITFNYPATFPSTANELHFCVNRIEELGEGYEVFAYTARHPILNRFGYYSTRVIVPQLVPLYLRETLAPLGAQRLRGVPRKLNLGGTESFNPLPHPFP